MWSFLRRLAGRQERPLAGAPAVRRLKTHSADSGYVYQYYFEGFRERPRDGAYEYVFTAAADRRTWFPVSVVLPLTVLDDWASRYGRVLTASERFGVAKIALRNAFDARETPGEMRAEVRLEMAEMERVAEILDLR